MVRTRVSYRNVRSFVVCSVEKVKAETIVREFVIDVELNGMKNSVEWKVLIVIVGRARYEEAVKQDG